MEGTVQVGRYDFIYDYFICNFKFVGFIRSMNHKTKIMTETLSAFFVVFLM